MLIEFSFGNFRSFKNIQTLHLQASKIKGKYPFVDNNNVFTVGDYDLLKSKVIYGANASGKTNMVKALVAMLRIIKSSFEKENIIEDIVEPFLLSEENIETPTFFQISFIHEKIPYRYGMQLKDGKVTDEWLFGTPKMEEVYYFVREGMNVEINEEEFIEAKALIDIREGDNYIYGEKSLFLTAAKASHRKLAKSLTNYFQKNIGVLSGLDDAAMLSVALNKMEDKTFKDKLKSLMTTADLGIKSVEKIDIDPNELPDEFRKEIKKGKKLGFIEVGKDVFNEKGDLISNTNFNLYTDESAGTRKLFSLSPFIFSALEEGKVLIIDEFDARLHPRLTRKILELFNSKITNPHNAQLIAVSHDTHLMDAKLLRYDQIDFVDKDKFGASVLKSLIEYKDIPNNVSVEEDYLKGKYGAVPFLNQMDNLFISENINNA